MVFLTVVQGLEGYDLPVCPFGRFISTIRATLGNEVLGYINYFLPVSEFVAVLSLWCAAIMLYYIVSVVLRWAKAIS